MHGSEDDPAAELQTQGRGLCRLARAILRDTDGADDVVQEARAIELTASPTIRSRRGWLTHVVQNLARRELRDRARRQRHYESLPQPTAAPAPDEVLAQVETHRLVTDAMLQLSEAYRRVLVLRYWHDLPPRTIARKLEMPVTTVKTHLQRALAELRQRLDRRAGDRRAWQAALVPVAHPRLLFLGPPLTLTTTAALTVMALKHSALLVLACLCLAVWLWLPWISSGSDQRSVEGVEPARVDIAASQPDGAPTDTAPATTPDPATARVPLENQGPKLCTFTLVGRIVGPGDVPVPDARIRLICKYQWKDSPPLAAAAGPDGAFELAVPGRRGKWVPYSFALADAPGWAVRELPLDSDVQESIADDRLDLGMFRLERGVAVRGRVDEADGSPLRTRARLLAWDSSRSASSMAMYDGRTVGFVEPGGHFELADRLSAGTSGALILAAISPSGVGWARLEFAAGQEHLGPVDIRLLSGGSVDVRVLDPEGRPIAEALVHAVPYFKPIGLAPMWQPSSAYHAAPYLPEPEALFKRRTDADGRAGFANLPRRQHPSVRDANTQQRPVPAIILAARCPGYIKNHVTVDPPPPAEGPTVVTIKLTRQLSANFDGTVATADGERLSGVTVRLMGGAATAVTDAEGHYELPTHTCSGKQAHFVIEGGAVPRTRAQVDIPPLGGRVTHDFVVEVRAPVTGRVIDQFGAPVAGVALHLGVKDGMHYRSAPERTAADGRFAFPDAIASHTDLWVGPPAPRTAWRAEPSRPLSSRDAEVIELQRIEGPLADLTIAVADGRTGAAVSPTKVELRRLYGNSRDFDTPYLQVDLALGKATATHLPPGRYRAIVRAAGGLAAERDFTVPADATEHTERLDVWPATAVVCAVDASALPPADLSARRGRTLITVLDSMSAESFAVDAQGKRLNYTPNTAVFQIGGTMEFRLEGITPGVPLRLCVLHHDDLFGEVWFRAEPGTVARVVLRLVPAGRLVWKVPAAWPAGTIEVDAEAEDAWRPLKSWRYVPGSPGTRELAVPRPMGDVRWRIRFWPKGGGQRIEQTGRSEVRAGETVETRVE